MRKLSLIAMLLALAGCATVIGLTFDERYGRADPTRFDTPQAPQHAAPFFRTEVQPILEKRCVVCHGCYDAPCQLKLTSWEGITRGMYDQRVYDGTRLLALPPTRLFVDAQSASQWRALGFDPVLNERRDTAEANLAGSVLFRSLAQKQKHPLPSDGVGRVLGKRFDFSLNRAQSCPRIEEFDDYERKQPLAGMPYGLPGLNAREQDVLTRWLAAGAPYEGSEPLSSTQQQQIRRWEAFLNGDTLKERLMSRYLYEHLFLGHLYFDRDAARRPFRLVRSRTPSGEPVQQIATRRPYDDPGVARVYYRLVPEQESILAKTHMPYVLSEERMNKYRGWFLAPDYVVDALPSYEVEASANPFVAFRDLPADGRYRFLLDEAQFFIMNFIKGPVCRGQIAVSVIQDQFWVFFVDPEFAKEELQIDALLRQSDKLRLPSEEGSNATVIGPWLEYAQLQRQYLRTRNAHLLQSLRDRQAKIDLSVIWDGDGRNRNASLTIFRHFDSASVEQGLLGEPPKTAWVIGYALFERIYYLLVAGYDVYGNVGHQFNSRVYMDFLRMEAESNFLALLPQELRQPIAESWYRGAQREARDYVYGQFVGVDAPSAIPYRSDDPQRELYGLLRQKLAPALPSRFDLGSVSDAGLRRNLQSLAAIRGANLGLMPEVAVLRVDHANQPTQYFTLIRNTAHANVSHFLNEARALMPADNTMTVVPGFLGAYPNAIFRVSKDELPAFERAIRVLRTEEDYERFATRFAVRRSARDFWAVSDAMFEAYQAEAPREAGLFDYNRLEDR